MLQPYSVVYQWKSMRNCVLEVAIGLSSPQAGHGPNDISGGHWTREDQWKPLSKEWKPWKIIGENHLEINKSRGEIHEKYRKSMMNIEKSVKTMEKSMRDIKKSRKIMDNRWTAWKHPWKPLTKPCAPWKNWWQVQMRYFSSEMSQSSCSSSKMPPIGRKSAPGWKVKHLYNKWKENP